MNAHLGGELQNGSKTLNVSEKRRQLAHTEDCPMYDYDGSTVKVSIAGGKIDACRQFCHSVLSGIRHPNPKALFVSRRPVLTVTLESIDRKRNPQVLFLNNHCPRMNKIRYM